jgi:peptidoglycan hydrolase-like protein with peptidoglycan-binding domain
VRIRINSESNIDSGVRKRSWLCFVVTLCAVSLVRADQGIRSLQQTLKDQGFYYGAVTGDKNTETTAAIRRYQIRNGLPVTGEINEETLRSVNPSSNAVSSASQAASKPAAIQPSSARADASARLSQRSPPSSVNQPDRPLETNPPYSASFYQSAPLRVNRRIIAGAQYQLMSRGYFSGRVDGKYGSRTALAVRAFQSSAGLPPTGRLDIETVKASDADFAYTAPASRSYETWLPVTKFKHGKWKVKWKKSHRPFDVEDGDEDRKANSEPRWNPYNQD